MSNKFHHNERLKSRKEIGRLFSRTGQSLTAYPLRLVFVEAEEVRGSFPYQAAFVVPKRRFKRAVDRNLIKRRMKEAFRLRKSILGAQTQVQGEVKQQGSPPEKQIAMLFIYTGKEAMPQAYIERKMIKLLTQLAEKTT